MFVLCVSVLWCTSNDLVHDIIIHVIPSVDTAELSEILPVSCVTMSCFPGPLSDPVSLSVTLSVP